MAVMICPKCGHENRHGAFFCTECFTLLTDTVPMGDRTTMLDAEVTAAIMRGQIGYRLAHVGKLGSHNIALYIDKKPEPLITLVVKQAVLGRAMPGNETDLRLDLSPYGAFDKGVSRQHAVIKRTERGLTFEDMGSSNGSWVNETLVAAYRPTLLASGDRLRLGQLEMEIYLP